LIQILLWWLAAQTLGWVALPAAFSLFRWLPDRGYSFSKILGLLLAAYFLWLGASLGVLRNDAGGALAVVLLLAALSAAFLLRRVRPRGESILAFLRERIRLILAAEGLFTISFVFWALVRAYASFRIQPMGGEKFMEIAFLNGVLNSPTFPPLDSWLSGFAISYYYFGYVMMAFLTRLTGALPEVAFDLYDALTFGLTLLGTFGVVYNLVASGAKGTTERAEDQRKDELFSSREKHSELGTKTPDPSTPHRIQAIRYGLLGAVLLGVMGNLEGLLESLLTKGWLPKSFAAWIDIPDLINVPVTDSFIPNGSGWFWWWRASRILQDVDLAGQKLGISPITEFPFFSFLLGDNHPHKMALPFVLLSIGLGLDIFRLQLANRGPDASRLRWWNPAAIASEGDGSLFVLTALGLGSLGFLNTWDMPIYIGLAVLAYAAGRWIGRGHLDSETVLRSLVFGLWLGVTSLLLYLFFYLSFSSQAGGILPYIYPPTRLPQYLVMFGPLIWISAWFLVTYWAASSQKEAGSFQWLPVLKAWGWVVLACVALLGLGILMALVTSGGFSALRASLSNPAFQATLGGLNLQSAAKAALLSRLQNPWLFLLLSLGLALVVANFLRAVHPGSSHTNPGTKPETQVIPASDSTTVFVLLLLFIGIALTFSVEFFYLRDQFGLRMNTVFKFYYQGWVLLAAASAYGAWWLLNPGRRVLGTAGRITFRVLTGLIIAAGLVYSILGVWNRAGGFAGQPNLNAASEIARDHPDDWSAIEWLRTNACLPGAAPVILEAPTDNYKYEGRMSAFTGCPTILGWANHEAQWRGTYNEQARREPDIQAIYTSPDARQTLDLLHKWNVGYVILGNSELAYIDQKCAQPGSPCSLGRALRKFETSLQPVFQQGSTIIYAVP
jgi:YYY domain-containing protein